MVEKNPFLVAGRPQQVPAGPKERENSSLVNASNFVNPSVTINYVAARLYKKVTGPSDVERPSQCTIFITFYCQKL